MEHLESLQLFKIPKIQKNSKIHEIPKWNYINGLCNVIIMNYWLVKISFKTTMTSY